MPIERHWSRIVISWDPKQVAHFLRSKPTVEDSQFSGPQFTFEFSVADLLARLVVYPRDYDVWLRLFPHGSDQAIVTWRATCDRIVFNDEIPEEGGPCLAFQARLSDDIAAHPRHPLHWLVIGQKGNGFAVGSFFLREQGKYP
jgi:hypothetical protein